MHPLTDEQRALQLRARELACGEFLATAAETDATEAYPWKNVQRLREAGFMGMTIPAAYGGRGASYHDAVIVVEEMAKACATMGRITVEANMGAIGAIMAYGTEAQKRTAAECVLSGDKPAICITEPEAGSAASEMTTRADRHGDSYVINGRKYWITGGGVSRLHLIFARVFDGDVEQGIGGFMVVRGDNGPEGLVVGERIPAMGVRGIPETHLHFRDLRVAQTGVPPAPRWCRRSVSPREPSPRRRAGRTVFPPLRPGCGPRSLPPLRRRGPPPPSRRRPPRGGPSPAGASSCSRPSSPTRSSRYPSSPSPLRRTFLTLGCRARPFAFLPHIVSEGCRGITLRTEIVLTGGK